MFRVDFMVQPQLDPVSAITVDRCLMQAVRERKRPAVLRVYGTAGDVLSLGRYHLAPRAESSSAVHVCRRLCGGRALPFGDGFIGVSLILPHRSALLHDDPFALAPYQVLNRYVRGILEACRLTQVDAYYPGRDQVTVDRRLLAVVSLETDAAGTALFEAVLANTRDFSVLPGFVAAVDREGAVVAEMVTSEQTTSLARLLHRQVSVDDVAEMLRHGYEQQFDIRFVPSDLSSVEWKQIEAEATRERSSRQWVGRRRRRAHFNRYASRWAQLGVFETYYALNQNGVIDDMMFTGDFIANSAAIEAIEHQLRSCPLDRSTINQVVAQTYAQPENFILGIGDLETVAEMILSAGTAPDLEKGGSGGSA